MTNKPLFLFLVFIVGAWVYGFVACVDVLTEVAPSPVDVELTTGAPTQGGVVTAPPTPPTSLASIELVPPGGSVPVGGNLAVQVIVRDEGMEVATENLTVEVSTPAILSFTISAGDRTVVFMGVAPGAGAAIVRASGLDKAIGITVTP